MSRIGIRGRMLRALVLVVSLMPRGASSGISPQDYAAVGVSLAADAAVPMDAPVIDESGRHRVLGSLISHPAVLVFADYTCTTLCGPIIAFVAHALEETGLRPGSEFGLIVVGLDPTDSPADAARVRRLHLGGEALLDGAVAFVTADGSTVQRLTAALGYHYAYDREHDQFVHPGAAYVLSSEGHVVRVLEGLGLSGDAMRLALVEASAGRTGTLADRVRLICSGFDPVHGAYSLMVSRLLMATGLTTMLMLGGVIGLLVLPRRRHDPS